MKVLVINAGSSSLKYQVFDMETEVMMAKGICERIGIDGIAKGSTADGRKYSLETPMHDHIEAFKVVKNALTSGDCKILDSMDEIDAVGHRVVMGGAKYTHSVLIDDSVIADVEKFSVLAPLHNPANIMGINACKEVFGNDFPQVAVFDNAFHSTMPEEAYIFPIPYEYYEKYDIRRYGFHGTSHRYVSERCIEMLGKKESKIITCHLGGGCSISAIKNGECIDTTMGLTPLDGFIMGTRSGAIDPSVVTFLQEQEGLSPKEIDTILNKKSGVLGVSGVSSDDRDVIEACEKGNHRAFLARKIQWYQIRKVIGSYIAALGGVDAIVFTGGIGENTDDMRKDVCEKLAYLGIIFDEEVNAKARKGVGGELSKPGSKVRVFVIPTDEELVIARDTKALCGK